MEKKQTVLIVHNYYRIPGGEDTVVSNEKELLEKHGHRVILYTRSNKEIDDRNPLKKLLLPFICIFNPKTFFNIKRLIKENGVNIVHVHNTLSLISPAVYYAALSLGIPVVQTVHNFRLICPAATLYRDRHICEDCIFKGLSCSVKHSCYRGSKAQTLISAMTLYIHRFLGIYKKIGYICLTEFNKKKLLEINRRKLLIRPGSVFVKPNFIDAPKVSQKSGIGGDYFICCQRLDELKGTDILIKAYELLKKEAPRLILCGSGPMDDYCRKHIEEGGLNIEMMGYTEHSRVLSLISGAKALILPTRWYEGFPMTIVEAFSRGTPVIVSDIGNAADLVEEGVTGLKFKDGDPKALARCLLDPGLSDLNPYKRYEELYTEEINYGILKDIYEKATMIRSDPS